MEWHPCVVVRMRANGKAVGVEFLDGDCETDLNVPVEHVRDTEDNNNNNNNNNKAPRDFSGLALLQRKWEKPIRKVGR